MAPSAIFSSRGRLYGALAAGGSLLGGLAYIGLADPHRSGFLFPACPFHLLTGWYCPGCGGLRMTHHLLHGEVGAAAVDNAFLLLGLPAVLAWVLVRRRRGLRLMPPAAVVGIAAAVVSWTVLRNVPGFPLVPTVLDGS